MCAHVILSKKEKEGRRQARESGVWRAPEQEEWL